MSDEKRAQLARAFLVACVIAVWAYAWVSTMWGVR